MLKVNQKNHADVVNVFIGKRLHDLQKCIKIHNNSRLSESNSNLTTFHAMDASSIKRELSIRNDAEVN